jgi:hypothetical protein
MVTLILISLVLLAILWIDVKFFDAGVDSRPNDDILAPTWAFIPFGGFIYRYHAITQDTDKTTASRA